MGVEVSRRRSLSLRYLCAKVKRKRRFFHIYARKSLKKAAVSALIGFLGGLASGLQMGHALTLCLIIATLTAAAHFLAYIFKA